MELVRLADWEMTYQSIAVLDYETGGQIYGRLTGTVSGERLAGELDVTNLAARRSDDVNLPTLRGLLRTADGAAVWVELDGIALLRPSDRARAHLASVRFRTGDQRYAWLNSTLGLLEGVLDRVGEGGHVRARLYECVHTLA